MVADVIRTLVEGREDWLAMRRQDVTASEVAALFGRHPYATMLSLYAEKAGLVQGQAEENDAMRRGRWMEPAIIAACAEAPEFDGRWIDRASHYYRSPSLRLGATPDAYVRGIEGEPLEPLDAKSVSSFVFDTQWSEGPPLHIQLQVLVQAMLLRAPRGWVACAVMTPELPLTVYEVPRHEKAEAMILDAVAAFWKAVEAGEAPEPTAGDHPTLSALFPTVEKPEPLDWTADDEVQKLLDERASLKEEISPKDGRLKEIDALLKARIGAHETAVAAGWKVTWKERAAYTTTVKAARVLRVTAINPDNEEMAA